MKLRPKMDAEGNIISDDESSLPAEDKKEEDDDRYELLGENFETFRKRLKFLNRYRPDLLYQEIFRSKNPGKYTKELRKQHQAKLSRTLHSRTYERLGVKERLYDVKLYEELSRRGPETTSDSLELLKGKLSRVRLSNLSIFPEVVTGTRREMIGTLEAYLNGFRYSAFGTPFHIDVMYSNVKHAFFQDKEENKAGDEIITPLLHLHLHNPIKVGTKMKNDIQFRMMYISRRRKRSAHHSCKFEDLNQVMRNFLFEVGCIWRQFPYLTWRNVQRVHGFKGEHPLMVPRVFCLTEPCIVDLVAAPFFVLTLEEVEIASLVLVKPEMTAFNMTFVFKDFNLNVRQIYSIPRMKLDSIKESLDIRRVKYYENDDLDLDVKGWRSMLDEILRDPEKFMMEGGWDNKFNSEETAADYSDSSAASIENYSSGLDYDSDKQSSHRDQELEPPAEVKEQNTYYANDKPGQVSSSGRKKKEKNIMPSARALRRRQRGGGVGIVKSRVCDSEVW